MTKAEVKNFFNNEELIFFEEFDFGDSIIGYKFDAGDITLIYSANKMIESLMMTDEFDYNEAAEYIDQLSQYREFQQPIIMEEFI